MPTSVLEPVVEHRVVAPVPVGPATGGQCYLHAQLTPEAVLDVVKAHSRGYRAVDALTALAGEPTGPASYDEDGRLPARSYPVIGWTNSSILRGTLSQRLDSLNPVAAFRLLDQPEIAQLERSCLDYVVLVDAEVASGRRPVAGAISARDLNLWCTDDPSELDGAFAVDVHTYRERFAGTGVAA